MPAADAIPPAREEADTRPTRASVFRDLVAGLAKRDGVRGGLLVTPDGLVITSAFPAGASVEALAALGATLGRQLELGPRGFTTALFAADDGMLLVGGSDV